MYELIFSQPVLNTKATVLLAYIPCISFKWPNCYKALLLAIYYYTIKHNFRHTYTANNDTS